MWLHWVMRGELRLHWVLRGELRLHWVLRGELWLHWVLIGCRRDNSDWMRSGRVSFFGVPDCRLVSPIVPLGSIFSLVTIKPTLPIISLFVLQGKLVLLAQTEHGLELIRNVGFVEPGYHWCYLA